MVKLDLKDAYLTIPVHPSHFSIQLPSRSGPCAKVVYQNFESSCRIFEKTRHALNYLSGRHFDHEFFKRGRFRRREESD